MSERHGSPHDSTAHKWLALIERRQWNFIELWETGRWQHYYSTRISSIRCTKCSICAAAGRFWPRNRRASKQTSDTTSYQDGIKQIGGLDGEIVLPDPVPPRAAGKAGRRRTSAGLLAAVSAPL